MSHVAPISFKCTTTIPAYRVVTQVSGTGYTVQLSAAATNWPLGITADTAQDAQNVPVNFTGLCKLEFNQTVAAGDFVQADSSGRGVAYAGTSTGVYVIGTYVGAVHVTTGTIGDVLFQPFFISVS